MPSSDLAVDRLITRLWAPGTAALTYFVRPGGNDANTGLSAPTAFLTLGRALREIALYATNWPLRLDVTGCTFAAAELLQLGGTQLGGTTNTYAAPVLPAYPNQRQVQIVATPVSAGAFTITSESADGTSGLLTVTVPEAIGAGALDDKILVDANGNLAAIDSYSVGAGPNTIVLATTVSVVSPVTAYGPGASFTYGDGAQGADGAVYLAALADWSLQWLEFHSTADEKGSALTIWPHQPVDLIGCVLDGLQVIGGSSPVALTGCVITNPLSQSLVVDGATLQLTQSLVDGVTIDCNGSGASGNSFLSQSIVTGCSSWGAGNTASRFSGAITNSRITGSTGYGVTCRFGAWAISDTVIQTSAASGILIQNASLNLNNVTGTNTDFGIDAARYCSVEADATITGGAGDVNLGRAGVFPWSEMPGTDGEQLARVFQQGV